MAIADDLLYALDRVRWAVEVLGWEPSPDQARVLDSVARSVILLCHRQFGKTAVAAVRACHELIYRPGAFVLIVSGGRRQADEAALQIERFLLLLPRKLAAIVKRDESGWHLANGSRVLTLPSAESLVRGFSGVTLLILDEAAKVSTDVAAAVSPSTASVDGSVWVMSTPFGWLGWFADHWRRRDELGYDAIFAPFKEGRSRVTALYVYEETRKWGEWWGRQEWGCEFLDRDDGLISRAQLVAARRTDVEVLSI